MRRDAKRALPNDEAVPGTAVRTAPAVRESQPHVVVEDAEPAALPVMQAPSYSQKRVAQGTPMCFHAIGAVSRCRPACVRIAREFTVRVGAMRRRCACRSVRAGG